VRHRNRPGWTRSPAGGHTRNCPSCSSLPNPRHSGPGRRGSRPESVSTRWGSADTRSGSAGRRWESAGSRSGLARTRPGEAGAGRRAAGTRREPQARPEGRGALARGGTGCPVGGRRGTANPTSGTGCQERSCGKASRENRLPTRSQRPAGTGRGRAGGCTSRSMRPKYEQLATRQARRIIGSQVGGTWPQGWGTTRTRGR
jgi:hypothetical protein